jgi:hypothetical protein
MRFRSSFVAVAGALSVWGFAVPVQVAQAITVNFDPGTYFLSDTHLGAPIDTLVVTVSGGVASFVLTGADNYTFSVPSPSTPTGTVDGTHNDPYYLVNQTTVTASWDASIYPYLTFYHTGFFGGLSVGNQPGDPAGSTLLFNVLQSNNGTGQVFNNATPLPATWTMMLAGLAGVAFLAVYRRRKNGYASFAAA